MLIKVKSMPFESIGVEHLTEVAKLDSAYLTFKKSFISSFLQFKILVQL